MEIKLHYYLIKKKISKYLIKIFIRFKSDIIISLILLFNLRKMKKIKTSNNKKKVIVLSKSGGIEDLNIAYLHNNNNNNVTFYELSRGLIKEIFKYYIKDGKYKDYYTIDYSNEIKSRKDNYKEFIYKVLRNLNFFWKFDACISFNLFYYAENDLPEPFQRLKKKFIVIHKESVNSPEESDINLQTYSEMNKRFYADKVAVYSENEKQLLIESNILNEDQIEITGCARSDYSYSLRSIPPAQNVMVYFMVENIWSHEMDDKLIVDWSQLVQKINSYIKELALANPNLKIIYKGKKNAHTINDFPKNLPYNCTFDNSHSGEIYLKNANIVMALNSTMVFEAILANRNVIIPFFGVDKNKVINFISKNPSSLFSSEKEDFFNKINKYLKTKYTQKSMTEEEKESVKFYLGNIDGKSGQRLRELISSII